MNLRGRTLRARVVRSTALVSAIAMAAMIITVVLVLAAVSRNSLDTRLDDQLAAVSASLSSSNGSLVELTTPDDSIDDTTWVFDASGDQVEGPRVSRARQAVATSLSSVGERTTRDAGDHAYLAAPVRTEGARPASAVVVISASLEPYETTRAAVVIGLSVLGVLVTIGSAVVAAWTLRRALEPVESMAGRAEEWSEHNLEARFDVATTDDEIAQLGRTLNVLLDRVAGALRSEQQLTAELAHELRTPLTAIRGEAELGLMTAVESQTSARLARVVALSERMTTAISTLVALARGHAESGARSTVREVVDHVTEHQTQGAAALLHVEEVPDLELAAPIDVASRALAPIIDNAVRYARTSVVVSVSVHPRLVGILVTDDGPGITETDLDSLFVAGTRAAGSGGAGLGLALSRRVARTLGGDVRIVEAADPTTFAVTLPRY